MKSYIEGLFKFRSNTCKTVVVLAGMRKRHLDSIKTLYHDQTQKLVVKLVEEREKKTHLSTWRMIFKLCAVQLYSILLKH